MISKLAIVHPDARLGKDVVVEPFAMISADVEIGDGTWIGPNAQILDGARIGKNVRIHSSCVIAGEPQDLKFRGEKTTAVIGDNCNIREFTTVNRGTAARGTSIVGNNCLLMAYVHVGHDCVVGDNVVLVNRVSLAGEVEVGDWAIIGGHVGVHQFCHVGAHSMIGGCTKIGRDVPPFVKTSHDPLSYVGVNSIGMRRRGIATEDIVKVQDIYRLVFQSRLSLPSALEKVRTEIPDSPYREQILQFISESKRGLIKPYQSKKGDEVDL